MKIIFSVCTFFLALCVYGQKKIADPVVDSILLPRFDLAIKAHLVSLSLQNPAIRQADAQLGMSRLQVKEAKAAWLNTVGISGNINEFVINNSTIQGVPAATLFPKYNFGVILPLGIFGAQQTNIARKRVEMNQAQKEVQQRELQKEVLVRYENYKEKRELLALQKQTTDLQLMTYEQIQREFASGEVTSIRDVNREYEKWIGQRSTQRTRERDLSVAELELEELIGVKLADIFRVALSANK